MFADHEKNAGTGCKYFDDRLQIVNRSFRSKRREWRETADACTLIYGVFEESNKLVKVLGSLLWRE